MEKGGDRRRVDITSQDDDNLPKSSSFQPAFSGQLQTSADSDLTRWADRSAVLLRNVRPKSSPTWICPPRQAILTPFRSLGTLLQPTYDADDDIFICSSPPTRRVPGPRLEPVDRTINDWLMHPLGCISALLGQDGNSEKGPKTDRRPQRPRVFFPRSISRLSRALVKMCYNPFVPNEKRSLISCISQTTITQISYSLYSNIIIIIQYC